MDNMTAQCIRQLREVVDEFSKQGLTPHQLMIAMSDVAALAACTDSDPRNVVKHLEYVIGILGRDVQALRALTGPPAGTKTN